MTAESYLRRVDFELRDQPWRMRRDLVSELRGHLDELPAGTDLAARLGPPEEYAADLRSAAGLERHHGPVAFLRARRPRNLILSVVALAVIGLAIGAVAWVQGYQPIAFADASVGPADARGVVGSNNQSVVFHEGKPFRFGITVQNTGSRAVRVLGVPYPPALPFSARLLMSGPQKEPGLEKPLERFRPFDLKPGEIRWLVLDGVYACHSGITPGGVITLTDFPVRFSYLWRTTTATIPLGSQLAIAVPKGCPATR